MLAHRRGHLCCLSNWISVHMGVRVKWVIQEIVCFCENQTGSLTCLVPKTSGYQPFNLTSIVWLYYCYCLSNKLSLKLFKSYRWHQHFKKKEKPQNTLCLKVVLFFIINLLTWNKSFISLPLKSNVQYTFALKDPLVVNLSSPGPLTSAMFLFLHSMREAGKGPLSPKVLFSQLCQKYVLSVPFPCLFSFNFQW